MVDNDYIMRLIQQFARVIAHIIGLKKSGQQEQAQAEVGRALKVLLGLDDELLEAISDDDLIKMLNAGSSPDIDKCLMLSVLLKNDGDISFAQGLVERGHRRYVTALKCFLEVRKNPGKTSLQKYFAEIEALVDELKKREVPAETLELIFSYYEYQGRFGRCEDVLFELLEKRPDDVKRLIKGVHFYQKLLDLPEDELAGGDLPRSEVIEGLTALKKRLSAVETKS